MSNSNNGGGSTSGALPTQPTATSSCPVLARRDDVDPTTARPGLWNRWFSRSTAASNAASATVPHNANRPRVPSSASACPVKGNAAIPASIEEAANHSQLASPDQRMPLATQRVISSIPRGDDDPHSGDDQRSAWQYPSEQQFYNALLKKGHRPPVDSIPSVLQIHNAVNERSWTQVRRWERELHDNAEPTLLRFVGRPTDLSPKAWWNSRVLMTQPPFDRHDWFVEDAAGGAPRRYVIDFYEGKARTGDVAATRTAAGGPGHGGDAAQTAPAATLPSMYIDVRPALDSPSAAVDRVTMLAREALPGLAGAWDSYKASASSPSTTVTSVARLDDSHREGGSGKQ